MSPLAIGIHAADGHQAGLSVSGAAKLEYADRRTEARARITNETGSRLDEATLEFAGKFRTFPDVMLSVATEDIGASEYESAFVKELILSHSFSANRTVAVGRMKLPFGAFQTAVLTDPETKKLGETKTDAGLGVRDKDDTARLAWNATVFANGYRTTDHQGGGLTANLLWRATTRWSIGAGAVGRQYSRTGSPDLANVYARMQARAWRFSGEYVTALNDEAGAKPRALSVDGTFVLTPSISLGVRAQTALRALEPGPPMKYEESALAVRYTASAYLTTGIELLKGLQRNESTSERVRKVTVQLILSF